MRTELPATKAPLVAVGSERRWLPPLFSALRPGQWVKNFVVLAGPVFAQKILEPGALGRSLLALGIFCLVSSAAYLLNDVVDLESDRRHPVKSQRPIAAGRVRSGTAVGLSLFLVAAGLGLSFWLRLRFAAVVGAFLLLNLAYTYRLKNVVILDVMAIAVGFVLRAISGAVAINVAISPWLVVCAILLALFLGFSKRRHELLLLEGSAEEHRKILREYSPEFLDQLISVVTASTVVAYAFYTLSPEVRTKLHTPYLPLTIPFVLYGIFRYLYLTHQKIEGGDPTRTLLSDRPLVLNTFLWVAAVLVILYF